MISAADKAEIQSRLARSKEFLDLARIAEGDSTYSNSIVSLCAQSAIAASDAVLLASGKGRAARAGHEQAPGALRAIGEDALASRLSRLLRLKPKAQYSARETCTPKDAKDAMLDASRSLELARAFCDRRLEK